MEYILRERIKIGISACNFGAKVRWNQRGWDRMEALGREKGMYAWTPVCPEIMSGLGVGRAPVRLTGGNGDDFWRGNARLKNRNGKDVSSLIKQGALVCLETLRRAEVEAFVFMEGSPSCGVYRTTLKERRLGKPPGAFGSLLLKEDLFLVPAEDLESPWKWWDWSRRLHAFCWLKRESIVSKSQLYEAWHMLKFICQEADKRAANEIGRQLADAPKRVSPEFIDSWKSAVLRLIRQPSTLKRIEAVMVKHYAHYRQQFHLSAKEVMVPESDRGKQRFIEELQKMEQRAFEQDYRFAGRPVIYKPENILGRLSAKVAQENQPVKEEVHHG